MNWNEFFDIDTLRNGMPNSCPHNSFTYTWLFLLAPNRFNTIFPGLSWELVYGNRALICIFISGLCKLSLVFVCHSRGNSCFFYFRQNNHQGWPSTTNFRSFQKPSHRFRRRKYPLRKIQLVRKNAIFEARSIYHAFFSRFDIFCYLFALRNKERRKHFWSTYRSRVGLPGMIWYTLVTAWRGLMLCYSMVQERLKLFYVRVMAPSDVIFKSYSNFKFRLSRHTEPTTPAWIWRYCRAYFRGEAFMNCPVKPGSLMCKTAHSRFAAMIKKDQKRGFHLGFPHPGLFQMKRLCGTPNFGVSFPGLLETPDFVFFRLSAAMSYIFSRNNLCHLKRLSCLYQPLHRPA